MAQGADRQGGAADPRVDELRQQLRALGYLDAGVDRFVLRSARGARRPAAIAALAAVRIGVLAGALLGPAAALGIGTRLPGLVTGPRDAVVIALYLAVLFGFAAALASFVASIVVASLPIPVLARKARLVSRAAGTLVGAACLVYLTLWWRIANPDLENFAPAWTGFALAVAAAISLLLGHATAISAFAVLVAARGQQGAVDETPRSVRRLTFAAGVIAFLAAGALLVLAAPERGSEAPSPVLGVVSPGSRIKVIAVDGFDPALASSLGGGGRAPTFERLLSAGAVHITQDDPGDPARAWTTIATGQPPDVHGVEGLETRRVAGLQGSVASASRRGMGPAIRGATDLLRLTRPSTASGTELRAKTFWEVAADAGLRPAVVNWWATWPAAVSGRNPPVVISDRATLRLERGGRPDGEIAPDAVYERLQREWPTIKTEAAALVSRLLPATPDAGTAAVLRRAAEVDAVQLALASRLDPLTLDLLTIYLPGLDIVRHTLLAEGGVSARPERLEGVRVYHAYLGLLLHDITVPAENELVVVILQPGRLGSGTHGLVTALGRGAAPRVSGKGRTVDLAPTILHALGVPLSRELAGAPMLGIFSPEYVKQYPVRQVDTYGRRTAPAGTGQPLDAEMIERLKSLGYVR